jgi:hypothetical protein
VADAVPTSSLALASTTGTISNFTTSTATVSGPITASTAVINIGSGQIYKDASGNVGIGISSPNFKFEAVAGTTVGNNAIAGFGVIEGALGREASIDFGATFSSGWSGSDYLKRYSGRIAYGSTGGSDARDLALKFFTANKAAGSDTPTERLRIDSSGQVGIGTTSPSYKLDVRGGSAAIINSTGNSFLYLGEGTGTNQYGYLQWDNTNNAFVIGAEPVPIIFTNGTERLRIDSSGNVGIGTAIPAGKFTATGVSGAYTGAGTEGIAQFTTGDGSNGSQKIQFGFVDGSYGWIQSVHPGTSARNLSINPGGGEVYIAGTTDQGPYNLQVNGTGVWGAGSYVNGSDSRIKEDIQPLASGLNVVEKLNPVTYKYKETWSSDQSIQSGFIAQELLTALDGQIYVDGVVQQGGTEGYYSVAYQNLIPVLAKAIQELKAKNDSLEARLQALESK